MKIEVGMYVRLDRCQGIVKIDEIDNEINNGIFVDKEIADEWGEGTLRVEKEDIIKASNDIFDLLECGDFLGTHCIVEIKDDTCYTNDGFFIHKDDIEDLVSKIITKEEFENIGYRIGDE